MENQWYEPFKISEWLKRIFSVYNLTVLLIAVLFVLSEFRFDWCERIIGNYLATLNSIRPETGIVWKIGKQESEANSHLRAIVNNRQNAQRSARQASSFFDLAERLLPGQWTNLDTGRFKEFYLDLPDSVSKKIIPPVELVWLLNNKNVKRIFCEGKSDGLEIYFLDPDNRVIREIHFRKTVIAQAQKQGAPFNGSLNDIKEFQGHVYPADVFFKALLSLPRDMISNLILNPDKLLKEKGKIVIAGISSEAKSGFIQMGFEFDTGGGKKKKVVFVKGREWAVWRLNMLLAGEIK